LSDIYISQDSAATKLKCGEIFNNRVNTNFPENVSLKDF